MEILKILYPVYQILVASTSRAALRSPVQLIRLGPSRYVNSNPTLSYNSMMRAVA